MVGYLRTGSRAMQPALMLKIMLWKCWEGTAVSASSGHQMPQRVPLTLNIRCRVAITPRQDYEGVLLSLPGKNK